MSRTVHLPVGPRRARERRAWRLALVASLALHLAAVLLWRHPDPVPTEGSLAAGSDRGDPNAARGGIRILALDVRAAAPPVPVTVPVVEVAEPVEEVEFTMEPPSEGVAGDATAVGEGIGIPEGTGAGAGGDAAVGLDPLRPASPRGMIIPPTNRNLRGTEVEVWVFVDARGRVVSDSTRLEPPTRDRDFNRRLIAEAAEWEFNPATLRGTPISSWSSYRITM